MFFLLLFSEFCRIIANFAASAEGVRLLFDLDVKIINAIWNKTYLFITH